MLPTPRLMTLWTVSLLCGVGVSVIVTGADARPKAQKSAKAKARSKQMIARRTTGRGHAPKAMLGPRWAKVGATPAAPDPTAPTTAPTVTYTVPTTTTTTTTTDPPVANALSVRLCDAAGCQGPAWRLTPSSLTLTPGEYFVQMQNWGEDPHDLRIQRDSDGATTTFPTLDPGSGGGPSNTTKTVDFTSPGTYTLFCSLSGGPNGSHYASGMVKQVTVTGS